MDYVSCMSEQKLERVDKDAEADMAIRRAQCPHATWGFIDSPFRWLSGECIRQLEAPKWPGGFGGGS